MKIPKSIYPFKNNYLNLNGSRLHFLDEGKGDPVVMVHGNPSWSIYYRNLVHSLKSSFRTIVPDHMGCGLSDKPDDDHYDYTLTQRIDDLETLLAHLKIDKNITLILHDWGGMIGMGYAVRHPDRIRRIVLSNTSAFHMPKTKSFPWLLWLSRNTPAGSFLIRRLNLFSRTATRLCCKRQTMPKDLRNAYIAPYKDNSIATLRFVQDIPLKPGDYSYDTVSQIQEKLTLFRQIPVLICWGEKDFVFDKHFLKEWINIFPQAEIHRFPDCGHYVLEDATEEITGLVDSFFEKHPI